MGSQGLQRTGTGVGFMLRRGILLLLFRWMGWDYGVYIYIQLLCDCKYKWLLLDYMAVC